MGFISIIDLILYTKQKVINNLYAAISSLPTNAMLKESVLFDASKSHDSNGNECKSFKWDFGDGVTDKNGNKSNASLQQKVVDEDYEYGDDEKSEIKGVKYPETMKSNIESSYVAIQYVPSRVTPNQSVIFDASKCKDFEGNDCDEFLWMFGDGTGSVITKEQIIK